MAYCSNCGAALADNAKFCENCGQSRGADPTAAPFWEPPADPVWEAPAPDPAFMSAGYSRLIESEPVQKALKKQRRTARIVGGIVVLLPVVGFGIYGAVSSAMDAGRAIVIGLIISAVFLLAALISALRHKLEKPFEGTVVEKKRSIRLDDSRQHGGSSKIKCTIRFECEDGKRRKKEVPLDVFNYLNEGERVRYLPQFPRPYEKYDKRPDGEVMCMFCGRRNPLSEQNCSRCGNVLIK